MKQALTFLCFIPVILAGCDTINVFEKTVPIPEHEWNYTFKPGISFDITDTLSAYNIFFVIRHSEAYRFNNIWVKITSFAPGDSAAFTQQFDFPLAGNSRWLGTGMDDIFEHRILLYSEPKRFKRKGTYRITIEQVMRDNPLKYVLNAGIRVEKAP